MARAKSAATATYLSLAVFYVGSLLLTVSAIGSNNIGAALSLPAFAWSVLARLLAGIVCIVIVVNLYSRSPRQTPAGVLPWALVAGVIGTVLLELANGGPTSGSLWLVAFALVTVHVWGAIWVRSAFLEVSTF